MRIEDGGNPSIEEAAAIVAALEAHFAAGVETDTPATPPSRWRLAARDLDDGLDAERARRRTVRRAS